MVPWTIIPYWSLDVFYAFSVLLCRSRLELDRHAWRIVTAVLLSAVGFLLFPLRFGFPRPEVEGMFGPLFQALYGFDQPFNQAPSLHISLGMICLLYTSGIGRQCRAIDGMGRSGQRGCLAARSGLAVEGEQGAIGAVAPLQIPPDFKRVLPEAVAVIGRGIGSLGVEHRQGVARRWQVTGIQQGEGLMREAPAVPFADPDGV